MPRTMLHRAASISAVTAALLAVPAIASAHPALNPNELPPGEAVESTLVVPHGCAPGGGMPGDGEAEPTVELAVQHTDGVILEPGDVEGWEVTDDGEAWVWSDDGGATTDVIELPVTVTVDPSVAAGEDVYLRAFQECADGSAFQWIGTPDEEASYPAVLLSASEGEVGTAEPAEDMEMNMDHGEMDTDEEMTEDEMADDGGDASDDDMADDADTAEGDGATAASDEAANDDGGLSPALTSLVAIVLLGAVGGGIVLRRRS